MPEVVRGEVLGFCMGVRRAVDLALSTAEGEGTGTGGRIYTLGPLIHNRTVLEELEKRGIRQADDPGDIPPGSTVIVRAHGVSPEVRRRLEERDARIIDATCTLVVRNQEQTLLYSSLGYTVILVGDRKHGEIRALQGYAGKSIVVNNAEEAGEVPADEPLAVIGQTTLKQDEYGDACRVILNRNPDAVILDTVCPATEQRQDALVRLAEKVDALVVVGGKNSANTSRLYTTAAETGKPAWHVEGAEDLPDEVFRYSRIGLSAGASTPDRIIDEVERRLRQDE
ncbi:MAG: 4-hydroxy-3-methylbut-2-enyl diphosphate reductase [Spirochaetia bacterium]